MTFLSSKLLSTALRLSFNKMIGSKVLLSTAPPVKAPSSNKKNHMIWFDLEMTGLDPTVDHIMEAACLITDSELNVIGDGVNIIVHQPDDILNKMNDWCKDHHGKSGLTESCKKSIISLLEAEDSILSYLQKHTIKGASVLAGNSVYMDRMFLMKYMPRVNEHMHYRIVDVSSVKELCRRWAPKTYDATPKKKLAHRALEDIKESIQELKYYKNHLFKPE
ncbi:probable oligoribonuclease [Frankliniella occidentalis]|uniref:Probable oligoribonuclease n=1 Tax=Frankliniella occidentalis TaxID=133901 RepID=A0A6J1T691_FRAOC|nr:probable oligoribonuclease [Frankliniella occidentalis]